MDTHVLIKVPVKRFQFHQRVYYNSVLRSLFLFWLFLDIIVITIIVIITIVIIIVIIFIIIIITIITIIPQNRPCKIVEMSTSKTGKHGHAKVHLVALDIFTGELELQKEMCSLLIFSIFRQEA